MKNTQRKRIALFGSFYRGFHVLNELLHGELSELVEVVGVATDDPNNAFVSPEKRVWQYPYTEDERLMVRRKAESLGIEVYTERVKTEEFYELFEKKWAPEICIMATFGQLISQRLFNYPTLGFYNLHPCHDEKWPSYVGGNPFKYLLEDKRDYAVIAIHHVNQDFDDGRLVAFSQRVSIPKGASVVDLHKLTSPVAANLVSKELQKILVSEIKNRIVGHKNIFMNPKECHLDLVAA